MPNKENENNIENNKIKNINKVNDIPPQEPDETPLDEIKPGDIDAEPMAEDITQDDTNTDDVFLNTMQGNVIIKDDQPTDKKAPEVTLNEPISAAPTSKKPPRKTLYRLLIVALVLIASVAGVYLFKFFQNEKYLAAIDKDTYYEGIYVDSIHVGGMTKQQAKNAVSALQKTKENDIHVTVTWDEEEFHFYAADVNIAYDTDIILNQAYQVGRAGTNAERYKIVIGLAENNVHYTTTRQIDPSPIESAVRDIAISKAKDVGEPAVEFIPDKDKSKEEWFIYSDPVPGIQTDDEALWNSVESEFTEETFGVVPVPKWEIKPNEDIDLREITQQIISFKSVQARNSNREHNIALACSMINGTVLMPGEEFSMNDTTGERTKEKGFKEANTIVGGNELVPGIAGGVCQVSGTLFNAALLADLEITERYHHSFELSYLKRGRDATVNYGTADLKFRNNHEYPIYIAMYTDGRDVYAEIYGAPLTNCHHIGIWVKTIKTVPIGDPIWVKDSTVPQGSEPKLLKGHQGITCQVYKIYYDENDKQIKSELAYTDVYKYYAPELHVNPADYERYKNPTPTPPVTPTPSPRGKG